MGSAGVAWAGSTPGVRNRTRRVRTGHRRELLTHKHTVATRRDCEPVSTTTKLPDTSTVTLTPNPGTPPTRPLSIRPPDANDAPRESLARPWTEADDRELASMKQDLRSRPSWKTIGARLHRDAQLCKLRWGLLKQSDQYGRINVPTEPETED